MTDLADLHALMCEVCDEDNDCKQCRADHVFPIWLQAYEKAMQDDMEVIGDTRRILWNRSAR